MNAARPLLTDKAGLEAAGQVALFGRSAIQAQAARDRQGRGGLVASVRQKPANEGLFAPAGSDAQQPQLFD